MVRPSTSVCILIALALAAGNLVAAEKALEKFVFEKAEMGVPFRITLYAEDDTAGKTAADAAFTRVEALNRIFSDYEDDSELTHLSRSSGGGHAIRVGDDLWTVLFRAQTLA